MSFENTTIGVIIPTYNGVEYLESVLPSLFAQTTESSYRVVVVDNASIDATKKVVSEKYPRVDIITLKKNYGFAEANNIAIQKLIEKCPRLKYVVFLNNDTIASANFLEVLEKGMEQYLNAASVQTKIVAIDEQHIDSVGLYIEKNFAAYNTGYGEVDHGQYDMDREIFGTTGSAMMVRVSALKLICLYEHNYFDPLYFAYNEDVDLAFQFRLAGFTSWYISGGSVRHVHSATGKNQSAFKSFHVHRNTIFNIIKNAIGFSVFYRLGLFMLRYIQLCKRTRVVNTPAYKLSKNIGLFAMMGVVVRAWLSTIWYIPYLLKQRYYIQKRKTVAGSQLKKWFV